MSKSASKAHAILSVIENAFSMLLYYAAHVIVYHFLMLIVNYLYVFLCGRCYAVYSASAMQDAELNVCGLFANLWRRNTLRCVCMLGMVYKTATRKALWRVHKYFILALVSRLVMGLAV